MLPSGRRSCSSLLVEVPFVLLHLLVNEVLQCQQFMAAWHLRSEARLDGEL